MRGGGASLVTTDGGTPPTPSAHHFRLLNSNAHTFIISACDDMPCLSEFLLIISLDYKVVDIYKAFEAV